MSQRRDKTRQFTSNTEFPFLMKKLEIDFAGCADITLLLLQVTKAHAGDYTCTPYNTHGTSGTSGIMQVHVRDPPSIKLRPEDEYIR